MLHLETSLEAFWETVTVQRVPLVLWGAGERGEFYNSLLRQAGISPVCFGDSNPQKTRGNVYFKGVPVLGAAELMERFGFGVDSNNAGLLHLGIIGAKSVDGSAQICFEILGALFIAHMCTKARE